MNIERNSRIPVYWQIKEILYNRIVSGELKPGDQLLSEPKLALEFNVNRLTVRSALTELVNAGFLYRVHGQGTFVSKPKVESPNSRMKSFVEEMKSKGFSVHSKLLVAQRFKPDGNIKSILKLDSDDWVYYIQRIRYTNGEPIVLQDAYIPCTLFEGLLDEDLETESLYGLMKNKYKIEPDKTKESLEAVKGDKTMAEFLEMKKGDAVLYCRRTTLDKTGRPIEYVRSWYRGDRYVFELDFGS